VAVEFAEVTLLDRGSNREDEDDEKTMVQVVATDPEDVQDVEFLNVQGEDSAPLNGSMVLVLEIEPAFKVAIMVDDGILKTAEQGEREIYSSKLENGSAVKLSTMKLDKDGHIDLQPGGVIKLAGNARNASGVGDTIAITRTNSPDFFAWMDAVSAFCSTTGLQPLSISGEIDSGADKVKLP
jgi:phage gp45-like